MAEPLAEVREVLGSGVVGLLRLLLRVEVVQVPEELVEAVCGGEVLVAVAEVVLAELAGGIAVGPERRRNGRVLGTDTHVRARHADLRQARAMGFCPQMKAALPAVQLCSP